MASHQLPHFDHHHREMQLTRKRFRFGVLAAFLVMSVTLGLQFLSSEASTSYIVTGRVYNASNNTGYANVKLDLCKGQSAVTNAQGNWTMYMPYFNPFCVKYVGGVTGDVTGPYAVNNNPDVPPKATYDNQVSGINCYKNASCAEMFRLQDRPPDSGYDLIFSTKPAAVAEAPGKGGLSAQTTPSPAAATPTPTPAAASGKPETPGNFQATVASGNAIVSLSWEAPASGATLYRLERSLDEINWDVIEEGITDTDYSDKAVGFKTHYFYRLTAQDASGNSSDPVTADVTTGDFGTNSGTGGVATTYTSDDSLVVVELPAGAVSEAVNCSVLSEPPSPSKKIGTAEAPLVLGLYSLICKTVAGDPVKDFSKPANWTYKLKDKLKGLENPKGYTYEASTGKTSVIGNSTFDAKAQTLRFSTTASTTTLVMAQKVKGPSISLFITIIVVIGIIVGVVILILRKQQRAKYDEYIRQKYYNI